MALDLASLASVRAFATAFLSSEPRLDILIHNAGEGQQAVQGGSGWPGAADPSSQGFPGPNGHVGRIPPTAISHGRHQGLWESLWSSYSHLAVFHCPRDQFLWPDPRAL